MFEKKEQYLNLIKELASLPENKRNPVMRHLCLNDLFFLCFFVFDQKFYFHDFAFDLCKKVEKMPWQLWLVARGHLKSKTITCAHTIQTILNNPELAVAIVSYNLKTAKSFVREIKTILETNEILKKLFPEILFVDPDSESSKWSEIDGLVVKRKSVRKEPTIMGFGLVDSQATGYHFDIIAYDDVVTQDSVGTPEMIAKTTERWQLSDNIGMPNTLKKYCGTRYHYFDTYSTIAKVTPTTVIPATKDGTVRGEPVFLSKKELENKLKEQGRYVFSAQMLLRPVAQEDQKFKPEDFVFFDKLPDKLRCYLAADPANTKRKESDFSAFWVFGVATDGKIYLLDGVRDKLSLAERYQTLKRFNERYRPAAIGYERYGLQADMDFFRMENEKTGYYMPLVPLGGQLSKEDRILRLTSLFEKKTLLFPKTLRYWSRFENKEIDLINDLLLELTAFPFAQHDDMSDCLSRVFDLVLNKPSSKLEFLSEEQTRTAGYRFEQLLRKRSREND